MAHLYSWFWKVLEQSRQVNEAQHLWRCWSSFGFFTVSAQPSHLRGEVSSAGVKSGVDDAYWKETMVRGECPWGMRAGVE